ncbi:MAG: hypothetical protein R2695_03880 [Acidimicrobiales bacterium]
MARYDNAFDETQEFFSSLVGGDQSLLDVLEANEALVEDVGIDLDVYIAGALHTILGRPDVYTLEVEGVSFLDWLSTFVSGGDPGDVRVASRRGRVRPEGSPVGRPGGRL